MAEALAAEVKHVETYAVHLLKRQHVLALLSVEVADNNRAIEVVDFLFCHKAAKPDVMS